MVDANPNYSRPVAERKRLTPEDRELTHNLPDLLKNTGVYGSDLDSTEGVEIPCEKYEENLAAWEVVDAVKSGTLGLRSLCNIYLPPEPKEDVSPGGAYSRRMSRVYFAPWYLKLKNAAIAQILRRPIQFSELSATLEEHTNNIDLQNNDLNSFGRKILIDAIDYGGVAIHVDYPEVDTKNMTRAEAIALKLRPYWVILSAKEIIDAQYTQIGGALVLTQIRIKQTSDRKVSRFKSEQVDQIKVYSLADGICTFELFEQVKKEGDEGAIWILVKQGFIPLPYIPIVPLTQFFAEPPMAEIACLNIKHFQRINDFDHALHIAANPKLVLFGYHKLPGEEIAGGVDEALIFENTDGRMEWVVCSSINFEAQERHIHSLETQMMDLAVSTMTGQKNVAESGLSKQMDRVQSDAMLSVLAQALQDTIDVGLKIHCDYLREPNPPTCQVNRDFQLSRLTPQDVSALSQLVQLSQFPLRMLLVALKDGEWCPEDADIDEMLEELNAEARRQEEEVLNAEDQMDDDESTDRGAGVDKEGADNETGT